MTHRAYQPPLTANMTGHIDPEYQREVDRSTNKLEIEYARETRKLIADERRHARLARTAPNAKTRGTRSHREREMRDLWTAIEARRVELRRMERLMSASPQSSSHRGTGSYRPVPVRMDSNI